MANLIFLNPMMLWGLAAVAAPILIHLLIQRQKRMIRFSTLRFLKLTHRRPERKRIDNWLLLLLRVALFALLALVFARPAFQQAPGDVEQPRMVVFVLDRSLSMSAQENETPRWESAKTKLIEALKAQQATTPVALVSCANSTEVLLPPSAPEKAIQIVQELQPTFEEADLGAGLQEALRILSRRPEGSHASVYFVTDLQRASCENVRLVAVPDDVHVELIAVGSPFTPQAAVRDIRLTPEGKVQAVAVNCSDTPLQNVKVALVADGKPAETKTISVPAFSSASLEFAPPSLTTGFHQLRCSLDRSDPLPVDDARDLAVLNSESVPVLLAEMRLGEAVSRQPGYFAASALDPGAATFLAGLRYAVERVAPEQIALKLIAPDPARSPKLVVLPSLQPLDANLAAALSQYVERGGSLMLFVGPNLVASEYNSGFQRILPGLFATVEEPTNRPGHCWGIGQVDRDDLFSVFRSTRDGDLSLPRFLGRVALTPVVNAQTGAAFDDGMPAILTRKVGAGRVAIVNTTIDATWSDWAKRRTFVPMLHRLAGYLVDAPELRSRCSADTLPVSANCTLPLGTWAAGQTFTLSGPANLTQQIKADAEGAIRELDLRRPGFYTLSGKDPVRLISAVTPASEQDLSSFSATDFLASQVRRVPAADRGAFDFARLQSEFWKVLLLLGLALAVFELYTANRSKA